MLCSSVLSRHPIRADFHDQHVAEILKVRAYLGLHSLCPYLRSDELRAHEDANPFAVDPQYGRVFVDSGLNVFQHGLCQLGIVFSCGHEEQVASFSSPRRRITEWILSHCRFLSIGLVSSAPKHTRRGIAMRSSLIPMLRKPPHRPSIHKHGEHRGPYPYPGELGAGQDRAIDLRQTADYRTAGGPGGVHAREGVRQSSGSPSVRESLQDVCDHTALLQACHERIQDFGAEGV